MVSGIRPIEVKVGEISMIAVTKIEGHVCARCYGPAQASQNNPRRTDWCMICGHRADGVKMMGKIGQWGRIYVDTQEAGRREIS